MFKAKVINKPEYYELRRKLIIGAFLISVPISCIVSVWYLSPYWAIIIIAITIAAYIILFKTSKKIEGFYGNRKIKITEEAIQIIKKHGAIEREYLVSQIDEISIKKEYHFTDEKISNLFKDVNDDNLKNFIIIETKNTKNRFDFIVDSHYMIGQLEKVIDYWKNQDINISYI